MTAIADEPGGWRSDPNIAAALSAVAAGPPHPFARDGMTFANREGRLPLGRYREFTVKTPGVSGRGPCRLIVDDGNGMLYLTRDHYQSFTRLTGKVQGSP